MTDLDEAVILSWLELSYLSSSNIAEDRGYPFPQNEHNFPEGLGSGRDTTKDSNKY